MNRSFALHFVLAGALFLSAGRAFGSPMEHHRIPQTIIVNGQQAEGVTVIQNGLAQTYYCPNPQPYMAGDQSSSGWACFDANSGTWLLNAMPPVIQNGLAQTFYCPNPQPYMAGDQSSGGSACFDANTGSGLLNAMPPASANVYTEPRHYHGVPSDQYNYAYPDYTYYPEGFFGGPALPFGFGFGHGHEYYDHEFKGGGYEYGGGRTGHSHGGYDGGHHR